MTQIVRIERNHRTETFWDIRPVGAGPQGERGNGLGQEQAGFFG